MEATLEIYAKFEQNQSWCGVNFPFWWESPIAPEGAHIVMPVVTILVCV